LAIPDYPTFRSKVNAPWQQIRSNVNGFSFGALNTPNVGEQMFTHWLVDGQGPSLGVAPTTAAVPTRATAGALGQQNSAGVLRYATLYASCGGVVGQTTDTGNGTYVLADRLSHQGGLSGIVTTAQTTNLPTAALTRYTTGAGVMAALEIYTAVGNTATTVTASYTNQAGTAGQISTARGFGARNGGQNQFLALPLASGDSGVRAVASVTVLATTGTAGNFGVTLFKPLFVVPCLMAQRIVLDGVIGAGGNIPQVQTNACLWWLSIILNAGSQNANSMNTGSLKVSHVMIEE
jgi:hypothetical protein